MTRREALAALAVALVLITAGLVWLFGPYGLIGSGAGLAVIVLLVVDVKEQPREALADAAPLRRPGVPVQLQ